MRAIIFIFFISISVAISAQVTTQNASKRAMKFYNEAAEQVAIGNIEGAKEALQKSIDTEPEFVDAYMRLAELHYMTRQPEKAQELFLKVINLYADYSAKPYYILGKLALDQGNFSEAIQYFNKYLNAPDATPNTKAEVQVLLQTAKSAIERKDENIDFDPQNLGPAINTEYFEYQPYTTADEQMLVFTRRIDLEEDFYISVKNDSNKWETALPLGPPVSSPSFREGSVTISPDGKVLFFAADYMLQGRSNWDLYYSELTEDGWGKPKNLGEKINSDAYESQPSISADGRELYFVSRRGGGYGNTDIWVSYLQDDCSWSEPENLGDHINTKGAEQVPFIHPDGQTLYFGSDGHTGMGGSDLYLVRRDTSGKWGQPQNLGYPINTTQNEGSIFVTTDASEAYFASDRSGGYGKLDLYEFQPWSSIRPHPVTYVKANIYDAVTKSKIEADFELIDLMTGKVKVSSKCHDYLKSNFLIVLPAGKEYALNVHKQGYLFHSEHFALQEKKDYEPEVIDIYLKPFEAGNTVVLNNVFFETDKFTLKPASKAELDKLVQMLKDNPTVKIEIGGHTDNTGTPAYNQTLSTNRAKAVYDYLVDNGISKDRLSYKGYGETKPIASNDTEAGKAKNRRTEFKVMSK